ncbi:MAG: diguanylate cyclase [Candidatus Marinimicrobia bacterium]|nr:diguanylate cyclase [Candidatus Neomarinimicrobiota bacterium]
MIDSELSLPPSGDSQNLSILIFDPDNGYREVVRGMLKQQHEITFDMRETGADDIEAQLNKDAPDVVVLGLDLQRSTSMEWLQKIREKEVAPVVILATGGDEQSAVAAMKKGAYDYIPKAYLTLDQLTKSLINAREKWRLLKETEHLQARLQHMAMYDALTETLSRRALIQQLEAEIQRARRHSRQFSILMLDIDHFKKVNDTYGHIAGDAVLRELALTLNTTTRRSDYVGRYGGEEFMVLLPETPLEQATLLAEKLRKAVSEMVVQTEGHTVKNTTISLGVAAFEDDPSVESFINRSDKGLYKSKKNGRNQVQNGPSRKD